LVSAASLDEYEFIKNAYFEKRAYEINDGNVVDFIGE
jgi:ABC-type transporter lipoprotein component MlaA